MKFLLIICSILIGLQVTGQNSVIKTWLHDSIIIGYGEASHGNCETYEKKLKFIQALKSNTNKVNVMVEMPNGVVSKIQSYRNGTTEKSELIQSLELYGLQTKGFLGFAQKVAEDTNMRLVGIDMQHYKASFQTLIEQIKPLELQSHELTKSILKMKTICDQIKINKVTHDSLLVLFVQELNQINEKVKLIQDPKSAKSIHYSLKNIEQCFYYRRAELLGLPTFKIRDSSMAENIIYTAENYQGPIVVLAANFHVCKVGDNKNLPITLGAHVFERYSQRYKVMVSQFFNGEVLSVSMSPTWHTYNQKILSPKRTLPFQLMNHFGETDTIVTVSQLREIKGFKLSRLTYIQDMGAGGPSSYKFSTFSRLKPIASFDAIYYSKKAFPCLYIGN